MSGKKHIAVLLVVVLGVVELSLLINGLSSGSRSILRANLGEKDKSGRDYALEINATNFDSVLKGTPASYALLEFFAHWCPACRNYKPHYEKVARLFNGPDAVHPGIVLMTRIDCALKINSKLCDKFSVSHYPMLFWGPPSIFASSGWEPKNEKSEIRVIDDGRTAERLLNWINKQLGSSYGLDDEKFGNELLPANISDPVQVARAVYDVEEATAIAFDIILEHKMIKSGTRASLIKFLQLIVVHHPSKRCRKGSAEILVNFNDLYPSVISSPNKNEVVAVDSNYTLGNFQICGKEVPRGYWMFCRGSRNDTRGFSCGLWVLLHSISVRIEDGEAQFAFTSTCDFIHDFFICEECRQHFYDMCSSVKSPFSTSRQFVLWLWSAHNMVNDRLMKEEASLETGDPNFPKIVWPPKQLCASCHIPLNRRENKSLLSDIFRGFSQSSQSDWDLDEVHKFLTSYYGETLVSLYKDKDLGDEVRDRTVEVLVASTNAVMVPLGAALAVAFASCAFGGLACYWRSQQKSRKYSHYLHPSKNI